MTRAESLRESQGQAAVQQATLQRQLNELDAQLQQVQAPIFANPLAPSVSGALSASTLDTLRVVPVQAEAVRRQAIQASAEQQRAQQQADELARFATALGSPGPQTVTFSDLSARAFALRGTQEQASDQQAAIQQQLGQLAQRSQALRQLQSSLSGPFTNSPVVVDSIRNVPVLALEAFQQAEEARRTQNLARQQAESFTAYAATLASVSFPPQPTPPQALPLRSGVAVEQAVARLIAAIPGADAPRPTTGLSLIRPLNTGAPEVAGTSCAVPQPADTWPLNVALVGDALRIALDTAEKRGQQPTRTIIRIADTGVRGLGTVVPLAMLAINQQVPSPDSAIPEDQWIGNRFGFAAEGRDGSIFPYPVTEDPFHWHGTQVTQLVMGGMLAQAAAGVLPRLIGLNFAKLSARRGVGAPQLEGLALQDSFRHAPVPDVINASVGSSDQLGDFVGTVVTRRDSTLVVVAAGNLPQDIGWHVVYPASYGGTGELARTLITVGAHDPSLMRARFSSFSARYVDLLAPGCAIRFRFGLEPETMLHGTSFAAPLVSLTAGIVRALGVLRPDAIKRHILRTTDYDPGLEDFARSAGRLNIPQAVLAVFHDVLQRQDGSLVPGIWHGPPAGIPCGTGVTLALPDIRSVALVPRPNDVPQLRVLREDRLGEFEARFCPVPQGRADFLSLQSGDMMHPEWASIRSIVPAALPP